MLFAYLVSQSNDSAAWSSYKPTGGETYPRAQKLANFVAPRYISGGSPIAAVQAQPLFFHDQVVDGVAFTRAPFQDVGEHYHQFEPAGASTMAYIFCGQADSCGLAATGAEDVIPLLRRESLELALYTFKYWPDIDVGRGHPPAGDEVEPRGLPQAERISKRSFRSRWSRRSRAAL